MFKRCLICFVKSMRISLVYRSFAAITKYIVRNLIWDFHKPEKDQCSKCSAYKNMTPEQKKQNEEHNVHFVNTEMVKMAKTAIRKAACEKQIPADTLNLFALICGRHYKLLMVRLGIRATTLNLQSKTSHVSIWLPNNGIVSLWTKQLLNVELLRSPSVSKVLWNSAVSNPIQIFTCLLINASSRN